MVRERRAAAADREVLAAGFRTRPASVTSQSGSGFESGGVLDTSEPSAMLAGLADAADTYLDLALDLATRLPGTAQALRSGVIDYPKARLIAEATRILTDADARAVEALVLPDAGWQKLGQ